MDNFLVFIRVGNKWVGYVNVVAHDSTDAANQVANFTTRDIPPGSKLIVVPEDWVARFEVSAENRQVAERVA